MVRKFEVGGVYRVGWCIWPTAVKVTRISADREFVWFRKLGEEGRSEIVIYESISSETAVANGGGRRIRAIEFHRLHPFFPTGVFKRNMEPFPRGEIVKCASAVNRFHKKIMKTFVLFFFSVKLIVIARRVKERMYAPPNLDCENDMGGIGFVTAQENFDRATKSQRIE